MDRWEKPVAYTLLILNVVVLGNNFIWAGNHSEWREGVKVSTSANSGSYFTFRYQATPPTETVFTIVTSDQNLPFVTNVTL